MKIITTILTSLFIFLTPAAPLLIMAGLAIGIDTVYGIYAAKKQGRFTSKRATDVLGKLGLYQGVILLLYIMDYYILNSILISFIGIEFIATKILSILFCYLEAESVSETYKRLNGISLKERLIDAFKSIRSGLNGLRDISKRDNS
jgi:hypothetical protein